jgi:hypothetical protein
MHRRLNIRTRTLLLAIFAVAISAQGLGYFLTSGRFLSAPAHSIGSDFLLQVYGEPGGVEFPKDARPKLPEFDPIRGSWTFDAQPLVEFARHVKGLEVGPHGSSPFVIIAFPSEPTVSDYHKALASLAARGICRVGVYAPRSSYEQASLGFETEQTENAFVPVYRVLNVKSDTGENFDCIDRFPAWAPRPIK